MTVEQVLAEVGEDAQKAREALDAENARTHPRKGVVEPLEALIAAAGPSWSAVDENSSREDIEAAATERGIQFNDGAANSALLTVIGQVDAAQAAGATGGSEHVVASAYVEREAGYIAPDYAEALEKGYLGVAPEEQEYDGSQQQQPEAEAI